MPIHLRAIFFQVAVYLAFFASGASCLIAEVTWNRMLIVVVGNSISAAAMIIAVFMGGLGLGAHFGGRYFAKRRPSLVPYILLELCIAFYVLLSPALFELLSGIFSSLAEGTSNRAALASTRLLISLVALALPALLMGATFPAIISSAESKAPAQRAARTGYLYSVNTLGAAVGCFVAGYHLLFELGVQATLNYAFGLYLFAALCALLAAVAGRASSPAQRAAPAVDADAQALAPASGRRRYLYAATFAVGFVALAYEVLLTRLGILYLGNSVSIFPLVLTAFLIGTGVSAILGTSIYGLLERRGLGSERMFGVVAVLAGVAVLLTPYVLLADSVLGLGQLARATTAAQNPLPILMIMIAPTILLGALLPIAIRMLQPAAQAGVTRGAATLYALNTAGGVLGASLANHFAVPLLGTQGVLVVLLGICVAVGAVNIVAPRQNLRRWIVAAGAAAVVIAVFSLSLPRLIDMYARKLAGSTEAKWVSTKLITEGRAATVTVLDQADPRLGSYRDMYLNGVEEASTRYWHAQLFKLLGIHPVLSHRSDGKKEVLVIAFGAGITAGSVLASDEVSALDVVDLNPDIEGINNLFTDVNGDVFHKPRFHFHNDDGRGYLVTSGKKYDVIINDSTHPRAYDSWILYTSQYYAAVKKRLKPGGVFAQWVPVLESMQGDLFKIHLNTFRTAFPNATLWYIYGSDQAYLMSTPEPYAIDVKRLEQQLKKLPRWFRADHYQIDSVARVAGFFWLDPAAMARMIGKESRINSDDVHYFDKQSAVRAAPPMERLPLFQASAIPLLRGADEALVAAVAKEQQVARLLGHYGFFRTEAAVLRAYCAMPENGNARHWIALRFAGRMPSQAAICGPALGYREIIARQPTNARMLNALADLLSGTDDGLDEAETLVRRALAIEPQSGMFLDTYGWILFKRKKAKEALQILERANAQLPDHPIVLYHLGAAHHALGRVSEAKQHLQRALAVSSAFPGAEQARQLLQRIN